MRTTYPDTLPELTPADIAPAIAKKKMLIVVNPYATTVSHRLKNLVVYALKSRYEVEAVDTESPQHATDITRTIDRDAYDLVVSFGGDGTANEIASGLAGTDIPISFLPGGATNVVCRTLGIPGDIVEATEHLLAIADDFRPWKVDLGRVNQGYFLFVCGIGLDALAFKRWDEHPRLKARLGEYYWLESISTSIVRDYLRHPYRFDVSVGDQRFESIQLILQNSDPATYFGNRPVKIAEDVHLTSGSLSMASLQQLKVRQLPYIAYRILGGKPITGVKNIDHAESFQTARVVATDFDENGEPRAFPVQVDGDYVGEFSELEFSIEPRALTVVA